MKLNIFILMFLAIWVPKFLWLIILIDLGGHRSDKIVRPPHQSGPAEPRVPAIGSAVHPLQVALDLWSPD